MLGCGFLFGVKKNAGRSFAPQFPFKGKKGADVSCLCIYSYYMGLDQFMLTNKLEYDELLIAILES